MHDEIEYAWLCVIAYTFHHDCLRLRFDVTKIVSTRAAKSIDVQLLIFQVLDDEEISIAESREADMGN